MKLISTTKFVLNEEWKQTGYTLSDIKIRDSSFNLILKYAKFLKQPLTIGMFVPCDMSGTILKDPECRYDIELCTNSKCLAYKNAKNRVLFEGFTNIIDYNDNFFIGDFISNDGKETIWFDKRETIEHLLLFDFEFTLTESVIKYLNI